MSARIPACARIRYNSAYPIKRMGFFKTVIRNVNNGKLTRQIFFHQNIRQWPVFNLDGAGEGGLKRPRRSTFSVTHLNTKHTARTHSLFLKQTDIPQNTLAYITS